MNFTKTLNQRFNINKLGSSVKTELTAGTTTFMTMAYILIVHPLIMQQAGIPLEEMLVVTALMAGIFSIFMGLYTNLPFALGPGMGSNAFFASTIVASGMFSAAQGISMVLISGVIFLVLSITGFRSVIVSFIPKSIKMGVAATVGIFLILLGLKSSGFISISDAGLTLGDLKSSQAILALVGLVITLSLSARKVKGAIFFGIVFTTILAIPFGVTSLPDKVVSLPPSLSDVFLKFDFTGLFTIQALPVLFIFFLGDFYSTFGTLLGVSEKADLLDEDGNLPNIQKPFLVDAIATIVGSLFSTTAITTFVESAAGVKEGGKTGLTAITTGILFLLAIFFSPIALIIPAVATAPALIIIGISMMEGLKNLPYDEFTDCFPAFFMIIITAFTSSISNGIGVGIIFYVFLKLVSGKFKELNIGLYVLALIMILYFIS